MNRSKMVTVVVPTVDRPEKLEQCLYALLAGERQPAEVVVVDQSGDERMDPTLHRLAEEGLTLRRVRHARSGLSAARNAGLVHATTAWAAFTDDDCVPDTMWVASIEERIRRVGDLDVVAGRVLPLGPHVDGTHTLSLRVSTRLAVFRGRALPWQVGTGGNMAWRVSMLRELGGYDERLGAGTAGQAGEDIELVHRLLRSGGAAAYDPAVVVFHNRVTPGRRLATRRSYGFGMGAYAGLWLRHDLWTGWAAVRWLTYRARGLAGAALGRNRWRLSEERLLLTGFVAGLVYGLRLVTLWSGSGVNGAQPLPGR